jgi:parallel beta-helix repeat protein
LRKEYKSEKKWGAVLTGEKNRGFDNDTGADWITVDGFEVVGARIDGIKMIGQHNVVRNCWVHNSASQGILGGTIIENNLVEFNGQNIQFMHGVYTSGDGLVIRGNIVRYNACFGLHLYSKLSNSLVANNVCYGNRAGIIVACPDGGGKNKIIGNTVVDNGAGIIIWNGKGEIVANNLVVAPQDPLQLIVNTTDVDAHNNLLLTANRAAELQGRANDPGFVNPGKSNYYLKANSPAIGKGDPKYASDFWGRPVSNKKATDIGAFAYDPLLTTQSDGWEYGWPYKFYETVPDFWTFPSKSK